MHEKAEQWSLQSGLITDFYFDFWLFVLPKFPPKSMHYFYSQKKKNTDSHTHIHITCVCGNLTQHKTFPEEKKTKMSQTLPCSLYSFSYLKQVWVIQTRGLWDSDPSGASKWAMGCFNVPWGPVNLCREMRFSHQQQTCSSNVQIWTHSSFFLTPGRGPAGGSFTWFVWTSDQIFTIKLRSCTAW